MQSPEGKLWDGEPDAGGATPTPSAPAAAPTSAATPAAPAAAATPTPAAAQAPATGAPGEGWVPSYRVRETREAAYREAQAEANRLIEQARQEAAEYRTKLQALVGVTPSPASNPEVDAVRSQFAKLYPGLAKLEERANDLFGVIDRAGDLEAQTEHYWQTYGRQTMDRLFTGMSEHLGSPLTEEGKRSLHSSFVGFVQSSPELTSRYASDPTIVDDFIKAFTSSFIDPVRRTSAAGTAQRAAAVAALPQDTPGGAPQATPAPKMGGLDERAAAAWAHYNTIKR